VSRTSDAQWLPAGYSIREFGAKSHSRAETGSRLQQPHALEEQPRPDDGVVHVLGGKALTAKGRLLLAQHGVSSRSN